MQEQFGVPPGLNAELEYELRKYARQHQQCLETKLLEELFQSLDRYGSGKILKSQVFHFVNYSKDIKSNTD